MECRSVGIKADSIASMKEIFSPDYLCSCEDIDERYIELSDAFYGCDDPDIQSILSFIHLTTMNEIIVPQHMHFGVLYEKGAYYYYDRSNRFDKCEEKGIKEHIHKTQRDIRHLNRIIKNAYEGSMDNLSFEKLWDSSSAALKSYFSYIYPDFIPPYESYSEIDEFVSYYTDEIPLTILDKFRFLKSICRGNITIFDLYYQFKVIPKDTILVINPLPFDRNFQIIENRVDYDLTLNLRQTKTNIQPIDTIEKLVNLRRIIELLRSGDRLLIENNKDFYNVKISTIRNLDGIWSLQLKVIQRETGLQPDFSNDFRFFIDVYSCFKGNLTLSKVISHLMSARKNNSIVRQLRVFQSHEGCEKVKHIVTLKKAFLLYMTGNGIMEKEIEIYKCNTCHKAFIYFEHFQNLAREIDPKNMLFQINLSPSISTALLPYWNCDESSIHRFGYNVEASKNLSYTARRSILEAFILKEVFTFQQLESHINYCISSKKNLPNYQIAVEKWRSDLTYLSSLKRKVKLDWDDDFYSLETYNTKY